MIGEVNKRSLKRGGPRTAAGKARASRNAVSHGLLSRDLLLPDEDPAEFRLLLASLFDECKPEGVLEQAMVERIAIAFWRQKRLVRVETARIQRSMAPDVADRFRLGQEFSDARIVEAILAGKGEEADREWHAVFVAALALEPLTLETLARKSPRLWRMLTNWAKGEDQVQAYLDQNHGGSLHKCLSGQVKYYEKVLAARADMAVRRTAMSLPAAPELMARYQAALDAELYKSLRALRELQRYRVEQAALNAKPVSESD